MLGKNQDIQQKLYEEVNSVLKNNELPNSQSLQKMPYLRGVLKESERLVSLLSDFWGGPTLHSKLNINN